MTLVTAARPATGPLAQVAVTKKGRKKAHF